jgi:hypothetical protein
MPGVPSHQVGVEGFGVRHRRTQLAHDAIIGPIAPRHALETRGSRRFAASWHYKEDRLTDRQVSHRRAHVRFLRPAIFVAFAALALVLPPIGSSVVYIEGITPEQLPDYDSRASLAPSADQLVAANASA